MSPVTLKLLSISELKFCLSGKRASGKDEAARQQAVMKHGDTELDKDGP